ncbi:O-fucosyltransferase family protein [Heracleum sosnowskyi]|uniref:O-fucosyltransferase family protein n=1 Tax=Heracleum sosnowskyi TaxID=360622 RepID=A0AAD8HXR9_9APIA|nr:O-fucosyltransferase family protein [Heracleum sosnowskyi]
MGKQDSPKSPRPDNPNPNPASVSKDYQFRPAELQKNGEPFLGRRLSGGEYKWNRDTLCHSLKNDSGKFGACKGGHAGKRNTLWLRKNVGTILLTLGLMGFLFLLDSIMVSIFNPSAVHNNSAPSESVVTKESKIIYDAEEKAPVRMYDHLLNLAYSARAEREFKQHPTTFWQEPPQASQWKPCADRKSAKGQPRNTTGFILVSANGGLNQQRVAVCNAVAVATLLNATLVIPKFLFSNVWNDPSQFGDIYQEEHFMNSLKDEVDIVKETPPHLHSVDLEATGSLITDADIPKEATVLDYLKIVLPPLLKNGVVHLLGFGNRLGFDPLPSELQKLRCKCNFHALKFVPKIQEAGSLIIKRIRKTDVSTNLLDKQVLGNFISDTPSEKHSSKGSPLKYLALHLRFEIDMVAYSLCEFGGGEKERKELQSYREIHFPLLIERLKLSKPVSPEELRRTGKCPLTPEEAALVLAGLSFKRDTIIYLAGSQIYGGQSRLQPLTSLYPNVVTKEDFLTPNELAPFKNYSSQLAALDFIACATADVFAMTDSGSQLSSLVSGFRTYFGGGHSPTLRPSKNRLATIMLENGTISWNRFEERVRKMIEEGQRVRSRSYGRSIYRQPRCKECMCKSH